MSPTDLRASALSGVAVAVAAAAVVALAPTLDLEGVTVLAGVLLGAVLVLADERPSLARLTAFVAGTGAAVLGDKARASLLPETTAGTAVAAAVVVLLCAVVAAVSLGHLRLWAVLLGAGAYAAVSASELGTDPSATATALSLLVASAAGFVAASLLGGAVAGPAVDEAIDLTDRVGSADTSTPFEEIVR